MVLSCPQTSPILFLIRLVIFFVSKIGQIRSSLDPDRPISTDTVEFSGTLFAEFQRITNDCVKEVLQEMPRKSAAFDTKDHDILIKRLHTTFGCSGAVLDWFTSNLSCHIQSVFVGHEPTPSVLKCGVPQGSVLGPLLFTLYTQSLSTVICQSGHSYHFFADDSQLHNLSIPSDFQALFHCLKDCIEDVAEWMSDSI